MTVAKRVVAALNSAGIDGLGRAYSYLIPASSLNSETKALIAVSEVTQLPIEHGSNAYGQIQKDLQVKICYPKNSQIDADDLEKSVASILLQKKWRRQPDSGHYLDDQGRLEIDLYFKGEN